MSVIYIDNETMNLIASALVDGQIDTRLKIQSCLEIISEHNAATYNTRYKLETAKRCDVVAGNQCKTKDDLKRALRAFNVLMTNTVLTSDSQGVALFLYKKAMRIAISEL